MSIAKELEDVMTAKASMESEIGGLRLKVDELTNELNAAKQSLSDKAFDEAAAALTASQEIAKRDAQIAELSGEIDKAKKVLAMEPFRDASATGVAPVRDGGEAQVEPIDLLAKLESLSGPEQIAFYRANRVAIDALKKNRK